jgi:hypothetical protein
MKDFSKGGTMNKKGVLTKILAIAGTVLVWLPIAAPLILAVASLILDQRFRLDYLMPAELFPMIIVGAALLLWAAIRAHAYIKGLVWSFVSSAALILICQGTAEITGLASGRTDANGWQYMLVVGLLIGFILAVIVLGVVGSLLVRFLYTQERYQQPT